jgi:hypothetical protein
MDGAAGDDAGEVREEGYRLTRDEGWKYVIFDPENPLAWILSDFWGTPPDADGQEDEGEEEGVR